MKPLNFEEMLETKRALKRARIFEASASMMFLIEYKYAKGSDFIGIRDVISHAMNMRSSRFPKDLSHCISMGDYDAVKDWLISLGIRSLLSSGGFGNIFIWGRNRPLRRRQRMVRVDIERVKELQEARDLINSYKFNEIEWFENGVKIPITPETAWRWNFMGLINTDFVRYTDCGRDEEGDGEW